MRSVAITVLIVGLAACSSGGIHQAEVLPTPFPGTVMAAHAERGKCHPDGCPFAYRVRISNPSDRYASVQECILDVPRLRLPLMGIGGQEIGAHTTESVTAHFVLPMEKSQASDLIGQPCTCTGLDWHGDPPI